MTFSLHGQSIVSQIRPKLKEQQQLDSLITNLAAAEYARKKPRGRMRARRGNHALAAMVVKKQHPELSDADIAAKIGCDPSVLCRSPDYQARKELVEALERASRRP